MGIVPSKGYDRKAVLRTAQPRTSVTIYLGPRLGLRQFQLLAEIALAPDAAGRHRHR
jgi:hypothetical protein